MMVGADSSTDPGKQNTDLLSLFIIIQGERRFRFDYLRIS